jgi:hypothetical protein
MSKDQKKEITSMILDYQLWVATIEQFMEDHNLTFHHIYQQLQRIKQELNQITPSKSIQSITDNIILVDNNLKRIQLQINQFQFQKI